MAKLFINKDIAPDADKAKYWMSGEDSMSFSDVQSFLDWMNPNDNVVDVEIHSCGGDCTEGYAIYDALRASGKEISCKVVGTCASMATVILLAAPLERRSMYEHAEMLIHNPYIPGGNVGGDLTLEKLSALQSTMSAEKEKMISVYTERTGKSREELEAQMNAGGWFGSEKAIALGFVSFVVPAMSAKETKTINNNSKEMKKENVTVSKSIIDRLLAKCGYAKIEDVPAMVAKVITTSTGDELTVEREEGEIQVGDPASPDGEFVLEDGRTVIVKDGVITEIKDPSSEDDETAALQERINELEAQVSELQKNAKSEAEERILASVQKAGGEKWLAKVAASTYVPAGRSAQPKGKKEDEKTESRIQQRLQEARAKNAARYNR